MTGMHDSKLISWTRFICFVAAGTVSTASAARAGAIRDGFDAQTVERNDDGSVGRIPLGFTLNFFGVSFDSLFINNNGNVTFDEALPAFTPFPLEATQSQIIAPFFADVDTQRGGDPVRYGTGTVDGNDAFGVSWRNVDCFSSSPNRPVRNSFQLVLIARPDTGENNFDIEFNYDRIEWESGEASGGDTQCAGGSAARVGFSNGTGEPGTSFELPGSGVPGTFLDRGPDDTALIRNRRNTEVWGRYVFGARDGDVVADPPVAVCQDLRLEADDACVACDSVDGGSFHPNDTPITVTQAPACDYALGVTPVTLSVTDDTGQSDRCEAVVEVVDAQAPTLTCPPAQTVASDADRCGTALERVPDWSAVARDNCDPEPTLSSDGPTVLPLGRTEVTFTAQDAAANPARCTSAVTVVDATAPVVTCGWQPQCRGRDDSDSDSEPGACGDDDARYTLVIQSADNCDPSPVIQAVIRCGRRTANVVPGMRVKLDLDSDDDQDEDEDCELEWDDGILEIEASRVWLQAEAFDATGNRGTCTQPAPAARDD